MPDHSSTLPVRVRFAPSPTGFQHVGGIRTVLFNYLFARRHSGKFIVRIEDTDRARLVEGATEHLLKSLEWLGLMPDEGEGIGGDFGPYTQSKRLDIYQQYADQLVASGALYPCWCDSVRLDRLRDEATKNGRAFKYDRHCLASPGNPNEPHVLRFRIPDDTTDVSWDDVVFGLVEFKTADLDDFVCIKSDNYPTYHFASVIDDHLMEISHVLRAAEWLASTPKHLLLYQSFDWPAPAFVHLPQILGNDGKRKLSKRDGAKDIIDYARDGYLPEALINFLATLGWNDGTDQELFSLEELIAKFELERIHKSPAIFDAERLDWMNGHYIRNLYEHNRERLLELCEPFWPPEASQRPELKERVLALEYERLKKLSELTELTSYFFANSVEVDRKLFKGDSSDLKHYLEITVDYLEKMKPDFGDIAVIEKVLREDIMTSLGLDKPGPLFMALRVALSGRTATPGLFEMMSILGHDTTLKRLRQAAELF